MKKRQKKEAAQWKNLMLVELTSRIKREPSFYISTYSGLKSEEINELRRGLEQSSSGYLVLKNAIAKIALENASITGVEGYITGSVGVAFGGRDPLQTARVLAKFSKEHEALRFKGGYLDGSPIDAERIKYLASLPGRDELIKKAVYAIKAPINNFVFILNNTLCGLVYLLQAIKNKHEKPGG